MIARFLISGIAALLPAVAMAQSVADTHVPAFVPNRTIHAFRPIEQSSAAPAKCHPESSKAIACEALQQHARAKLAADLREADTIELSDR